MRRSHGRLSANCFGFSICTTSNKLRLDHVYNSIKCNFLSRNSSPKKKTTFDGRNSFSSLTVRSQFSHWDGFPRRRASASAENVYVRRRCLGGQKGALCSQHVDVDLRHFGGTSLQSSAVSNKIWKKNKLNKFDKNVFCKFRVVVKLSLFRHHS